MSKLVIKSSIVFVLNLICLLMLLTVQVFAVDRNAGRLVLAEMNLARTKPHVYAA